MDDIKGFCQELRTTPLTRIKTTWYASLVLSFVILLLGLIAADENNHNLNNGNKGAGFAAIWTTFVLVAVAAAGTSLLRAPAKSPLGLGALLGAVFMLSQMMLTLFAVFIGLAAENEEDDVVDDAGTNDANRGLAAFYFLQVLEWTRACPQRRSRLCHLTPARPPAVRCLLLFAAMLAFHRRLVIDEPDALPAADPVSETRTPRRGARRRTDRGARVKAVLDCAGETEACGREAGPIEPRPRCARAASQLKYVEGVKGGPKPLTTNTRTGPPA